MKQLKKELREEELEKKILTAIKTAYELALASNDSDQKKGIDNFYHIHLNPLQYQIGSWIRELEERNQLRAEQRERLNKETGDTYTCKDCGGLYHAMFEICPKRMEEGL